MVKKVHLKIRGNLVIGNWSKVLRTLLEVGKLRKKETKQRRKGVGKGGGNGVGGPFQDYGSYVLRHHYSTR